MSDLATLQTQLAALKRTRASGVATLRKDDRGIEYRSDAELATQIAALESEIAGLTGQSKPRTIAVRSNKGWL
jgi:hypothetical protein